MRTRILLGTLLVLGLALLFWLDRHAGGLLVCLGGMALTGAALHELFAMARAADLRPFRGTGIAFGVVLVPYYLYCEDLENLLGTEPLVAFVIAPLLALILAVMARAVSRPEGLTSQFKNIAVTVFGVLYVALPMAFLVRTRFLAAEEGWLLLILVLATAKTSDSAAYFTGKLYGRHKLAPRVSPNKTIEGAAGGLVGSVLVAVAIVYGCDIQVLTRVGLYGTIAFGLLVGVGSQAGDLTESLLKRSAGIKDSGRVLPAFGGVLDLVDSFLVAAPVAYFLLATFASLLQHAEAA
jgi:phosphatidate cytidylyltransferase